jgi:hypothetical protein
MICQCDCVNCDHGDHDHCEHDCHPVEDDDDPTEIGYDPEPNKTANRLWDER